MSPVRCETANSSTSHGCRTTWRPTCRRRRDRSTVEQFPHGHSNLTYLLRLGDQEWVLRRPPFGNRVKTAHDMGREYRILSRLCQVYPPAPRPVLYCEDESDPGRTVLPDGAAQRGHPPRHSAARPADSARAGAAALRDARRQHGPAARARLPRGRAGRPRQARGLRRAPGDRLDQAVPGRPDRRRPRPGADDRPGWPRTGRPSRPVRP